MPLKKSVSKNALVYKATILYIVGLFSILFGDLTYRIDADTNSAKRSHFSMLQL